MKHLVILGLFALLSACTCGEEVIPTPVDLRVSPERLEFRPTLVGSVRERMVLLSNAGRTELDVQLELPAGTPFSARKSVQLASGDLLAIAVTFSPKDVGPVSATLVVSAGSESVLVELAGEGALCEDRQDCTARVWDEEEGRCFEVQRHDGAGCQTRCAIGGYCMAGVCEAVVALDCDDKNPCTADTCDESVGCVHDDATASCPAPTEVCRVAVCDSTSGCGFALAADGTACEDGCIVGTCSAGACAGGRKGCDDGNPCTTDACDDVKGCVHEDGTDFCPVPNPCYAPTCDPATGCGAVLLADGTPCGPATCETSHFCEAGQCVAVPTPASTTGCGCDDQPVRPTLISAGDGMITCRVTSSGGVECWGANIGGDGTIGGTRYLPAPVLGLSDVVEVSAGGSHACARTSSGELYCWGHNHRGQIGPEAAEKEALPFRVPGLGPVVSISAGADTTCAVLRDGTVWCWGQSDSGQVGDGSYGFAPDGRSPRVKPRTRVPGIRNAVSVSVGSAQGCALLSDSTVRCWGRSHFSIGDGEGDLLVRLPTEVQTPSGVLHGAIDVHVGEPGTCVRTLFGEVRCVRTVVSESARATFPEIGPWFGRVNVSGCPTQISSGYGFGCARLRDATARCWAFDPKGTEFGCLGTGSTAMPPGDISNVSGLSGVAEIRAGASHACALLEDGSYRCWGRNLLGELGDGTNVPRYAP